MIPKKPGTLELQAQQAARQELVQGRQHDRKEKARKKARLDRQQQGATAARVTVVGNGGGGKPFGGGNFSRRRRAGAGRGA